MVSTPQVPARRFPIHQAGTRRPLPHGDEPVLHDTCSNAVIFVVVQYPLHSLVAMPLMLPHLFLLRAAVSMSSSLGISLQLWMAAIIDSSSASGTFGRYSSPTGIFSGFVRAMQVWENISDLNVSVGHTESHRIWDKFIDSGHRTQNLSDPIVR